MDKVFAKGVGTSPHTTALKRNRSQWGQQFEASSRNDAEEMQLLCTQNLAQTLSSWLHSHFLLTRTTLNLLKSWTNSSTRESGHHHAQPLWKEIGVNADNSSKQAAGTMRKNCSFCALKTLHKLCPPDCIHTFYSLVQLSTCWSRKGSGDITSTTALKRNRSQCRQQFEASSLNDAEELQLLCTQHLAQPLSCWFHSPFLLTLIRLSNCWCIWSRCEQ